MSTTLRRRGFNLEHQAPRTRVLSGTVTITSAGAISAQDSAKFTGATVAKTGGKSGRYAITFQRTYKRIIGAGAAMVGPDDSAFPTTTGSTPKLRLLTTSGFSVQFVREDTQADADPASGTTFTWFAMVAWV
jgi:hypothetical protein